MQEDEYALRLQANDLAEETGSMNKKGEVAARVWEGLAAVDVGRLYVTYQSLELVDSTLMNNKLYIERTIWEKWFMYKLQDAKLSRVFESLPNSIPAALGIMRPEPPTTAVVQLDNQGMVVKSGPQPEMLLSLLV